MQVRWLSLILAMGLPLALAGCDSAADGRRGQELPDLSFSEYSDWSQRLEIARRLRSRADYAQLQNNLATRHTALRPQAIDLAMEHFFAYLPAAPPPYGLLVFVSPGDLAKLPRGWGEVLDRYGLILVRAAHSGNDANVLERRVPLALLAAQNMLDRYPIDRERVYVGGFSGGSRVALKLAVGYPDLFRGALLNAGSDTLDSPDLVPPPDPLFDLFLSNSRLVYLTGEQDSVNLARDRDSQSSMRRAGQTRIDSVIMPGVGHVLAPSDSLSVALSRLGAARSMIRAQGMP